MRERENLGIETSVAFLSAIREEITYVPRYGAVFLIFYREHAHRKPPASLVDGVGWRRGSENEVISREFAVASLP